MTKSIEIQDCIYPREALLITPSKPTPRYTIYLSNLDDQPFLRFSIRYLYVYRRSTCVEKLKNSLSRVLVDYYPLAGRLRASSAYEGKLEVECNGEGALFAEGYLDLSAEEFLEGSRLPNRSWRNLLYRMEGQGFLGVPPLVIQVIHLNCGGMILCTVINHCLCDGIGTSQFLQAWAQITAKPTDDPPITPFHSRHMLKPQTPPRIASSHPEFNVPPTHEPTYNLLPQLLQSQTLVPVSVTFTPSHILCLKKLCIPSSKCTSFEVLASHVWRTWVRTMDLPSALNVKLLFSVNARKKLNPELPRGYYGNGFVLGCAEASVDRLTRSNLHYSVKLVQQAKERINDGHVRSVIDLLEETRMKPDLSTTLVISQWSKLGLEDLDFGEGRPLHMGPLASEIYCLFLPVIGDLHAFTVLVSVPQGIAERFENLLKGFGEESINIGGRAYN